MTGLKRKLPNVTRHVSVNQLRPDHQQIMGSGVPSKMTLSIIQNFPDEPMKLMEFVTPMINYYGKLYMENGYHIIEVHHKYEGTYLLLSALNQNYNGFWKKYFYHAFSCEQTGREFYYFNIAKQILKNGVG